MPKNKKLIDKRFGLLVVLEDAGKSKHRKTILKCQCDCGNTTIVQKTDLCAGKTRSCGCMQGGITHGMSHTPEYKAWRDLIQRCTNPNNKRYKDYGGRGITVCDRWRNSFEAFHKDMGPKPDPKYSIDRINNDLGYCPDNCEWSDDTKQIRNRGVQKNNKSGTPGIYWHKNNKKWRAVIMVDRKEIHLGYFKDFDDAKEARKQGELKYWGNRGSL